MFRLLMTIVLALGIPTQMLRAEPAKSILVLDASGSMWGQIDGEAKISIAQSVINGLLDDLPAEQALGLTVYGHRRRGDCSDIETLVRPESGDRDAIRKAVNALKPRGKTPLSAAVVKAAQDLRHTEDPATVILVSDGLETCAADACAIAAELEKTGVDFTAHVIGFDLATDEERAQLQCIADITGGQFLTATNADELTRALQRVTADPVQEKIRITREAPELRPFNAADFKPRLRVRALFAVNGLVVREGVSFTLVDTKTGAVQSGERGIFLDLKPAIYRVTATLAANNAEASRDVLVNQNTDATYDLVLPLFQPEATLNLPDQAALGSRIEVSWSGPDGTGDYLATARPNDQPGSFVTFTGTQEGARLALEMPDQPGLFEVRYYHAKTGKVLASRAIRIISQPAALNAAAKAAAGSVLSVKWAGPDQPGDYLSIAPQGAQIGVYTAYAYTEDGNEIGILLPPEPGPYELRYMTDKGRTILAAMPIEVTPGNASQ